MATRASSKSDTDKKGGASKSPKGEAAKAEERPPAEAAPTPEPVEPAPAPEASPEEDQASPMAELLHPRAIPRKRPDENSPPPGLAPPGDSRSMRRQTDDGEEFCLIYRLHRSLITRRGLSGKWGEVEVRDYPSLRSAATAYAQACSNLTGEGFYDLRE